MRTPERRDRIRTGAGFALLGMPTLGLAFSITMVSTYLPKVERQFTSSATVIGVIVAAEGLMALWVPLVVGTWSDGVRSRLGGRVPFVLAGVPVVGAALVAMSFVDSLPGLALAAGCFFCGYFVAYGPYRALYPDLVEESAVGRAQSVQALWRGAGTGLAMVGGGVMLATSRWLPFITAAVVLGAVTLLFVALLDRRLLGQEPRAVHGLRSTIAELRRLLAAEPRLRSFLVANALWELTLAALKTFVVLYITDGLGHRLITASLVIGAAALVVLLAAGASGALADRYGRPHVMLIGLLIYSPGLLLPFVTRDTVVLAVALPLVALGGAS